MRGVENERGAHVAISRSRGASLLLKQFVRFASTGAIGTAVHYCVLVVLVELFSAGPTGASAVGAGCGAITNYFLNYYFTFATSRSHSVAAPLFIMVATTGLALNTALMALLVNSLVMPYLPAQVCVTALVVCWTFCLNRFVTFRV